MMEVGVKLMDEIYRRSPLLENMMLTQVKAAPWHVRTYRRASHAFWQKIHDVASDHGAYCWDE